MNANHELLNSEQLDVNQIRRSLFDRVVKWNVDRDHTTFNHTLETQMLAEELFEFCDFERQTAKDAGIDFAKAYSICDWPEPINGDKIATVISRDALADAAGDLIFIAIGTIAKLGLNPYNVLKTICDHNDAKGKIKDAQGKIIKCADFIEPIHEVR